MSKAIHLDFELIELAGTREVCVLGSVSFHELLSEHLNLFLGPSSPFISQIAAVFSCDPLTFRDLNKLLVSCSLLSRLKLHPAALFFEVSLYAISLLA